MRHKLRMIQLQTRSTKRIKKQTNQLNKQTIINNQNKLTNGKRLTQTTTILATVPHFTQTTTISNIPQKTHHTFKKKKTLGTPKIPGHKLPHGHIPLSLPSLTPLTFLNEQHANKSSVELTQPSLNVSSATNFSSSSRKNLFITHPFRIHSLLSSK